MEGRLRTVITGRSVPPRIGHTRRPRELSTPVDPATRRRIGSFCSARGRDPPPVAGGQLVSRNLVKRTFRALDPPDRVGHESVERICVLFEIVPRLVTRKHSE